MSTLILRPTQDTATAQQECSSGVTHYILIDEATKDEADYFKKPRPININQDRSLRLAEPQYRMGYDKLRNGQVCMRNMIWWGLLPGTGLCQADD